MVESLRKTHVSRCNHRLVSAEHHIVLARCATQGDWRTALWVYELGKFLNRHPRPHPRCDPPPNLHPRPHPYIGASKHIRPSMPATFSTLLLACKNADPPESAAALPLLEEVEAQVCCRIHGSSSCTAPSTCLYLTLHHSTNPPLDHPTTPPTHHPTTLGPCGDSGALPFSDRRLPCGRPLAARAADLQSYVAPGPRAYDAHIYTT